MRADLESCSSRCSFLLLCLAAVDKISCVMLQATFRLRDSEQCKDTIEEGAEAVSRTKTRAILLGQVDLGIRLVSSEDLGLTY